MCHILFCKSKRPQSWLVFQIERGEKLFSIGQVFLSSLDKNLETPEEKLYEC